jgi:RNAse (barnase) inhibitor barstar
MRSAEFLVGLLTDASTAFVTTDDFVGPHADALRRWQQRGFVARESGRHPAPSCPHCGEGVPYLAGYRVICDTCGSTVDSNYLFAWPVERDTCLSAIAKQLGLRDSGGRATDDLWDLGHRKIDDQLLLCFFHAGERVSPESDTLLRRYRHVVVLSRILQPDRGGERWVPMIRLIEPDGAWATITLADLIGASGAVRFELETGVMHVGDAVAGEVPLGSREWAMLAVLAAQVDQFVPYAAIKREVLRRTGGHGGAEEATFCQKIKSRIKKKYIPTIDTLVATSNKREGYRLRAER